MPSRKDWTHRRCQFSNTSSVPICLEVAFIGLVDLHSHLLSFSIFAFDLWWVDILCHAFGHEKWENASAKAAECKGGKEPGEAVGVWKIQMREDILKQRDWLIPVQYVAWFCELYAIYMPHAYDKKSDEGSNSVRMRPENSGALKVVKKWLPTRVSDSSDAQLSDYV